jgi:hypothetical protein
MAHGVYDFWYSSIPCNVIVIYKLLVWFKLACGIAHVKQHNIDYHVLKSHRRIWVESV